MNEQEILDRAKRAAISVDGLDQPYDALLRRRDRKRRNQRIAACVVGSAMFVAAIGIVTSGLSLDRSSPAVPGSETGPAETAPPPAPASAAPDVVSRGYCGGQPGEARLRLELTDIGDRIRMRFVLHGSAPGDRWTIWIFRHGPVGGENLVFQGTMVASDGGDFVVQRFYWDNNRDGFRIRAQDSVTNDPEVRPSFRWRTDQICGASDWIG